MSEASEFPDSPEDAGPAADSAEPAAGADCAEPDSAAESTDQPTVIAKTVAATERARAAVEEVITGAKETAAEAFDKVIDSLDSLGNKHQ